ncbi:DUF58 domain-containing protein [Flavipsychrobacter stenotrophus]|uniref:DUF58 domain-containing protein n=1 Tax=Flavipsychrobacter stenotrophus TaxID=2077091 RepID=A0A2S7SSV8_9BACT|nr:DUF58 domain-containing protein [Flavipsychrobacter stenotrophus]
MGVIRKYIGDLQISNRWYLMLSSCVVLFFVSFFFTFLFRLVFTVTMLVFFFTIVDYVLLFFMKGGLTGHREMASRFSIGDDNEVVIQMENEYPFRVHGFLIDELPVQFQVRDFHLDIAISLQSKAVANYNLKPLSRGEYHFGDLICYVSSPLGLLQRRIILAEPEMVKVYPAFQQLKKYQLQFMATNTQTVAGLKKVRRLGHSLEFEKIKDYVPGDDVRTINWKATARSNSLMVNTFTDARQQQIYCLIDKGRNMKMPFEGMTLLDYSINACLAMLNVALMKQDKAGIITFSNKVNDIVAADRRNNQLHHILETLYKQQTDFKESDYEAVWVTIHKRITQRSLVLFFTNFETYSSLERQLPFLKKIAQNHLICVIFFQNTLLEEIHESTPDDIEGIYIKTIADQFAYEKRQIVKVLRQHGILSILTTPQNLNVDVINKYLEMKARQMV